jgi:hypothetical protein
LRLRKGFKNIAEIILSEALVAHSIIFYCAARCRPVLHIPLRELFEIHMIKIPSTGGTE